MYHKKLLSIYILFLLFILVKCDPYISLVDYKSENSKYIAITIQGANFGVSGLVILGSTSISTSSYSDKLIFFDYETNQSQLVNITVISNGKYSNPYLIQIVPTINVITPIHLDGGVVTFYGNRLNSEMNNVKMIVTFSKDGQTDLICKNPENPIVNNSPDYTRLLCNIDTPGEPNESWTPSLKLDVIRNAVPAPYLTFLNLMEITNIQAKKYSNYYTLSVFGRYLHLTKTILLNNVPIEYSPNLDNTITIVFLDVNVVPRNTIIQILDKKNISTPLFKIQNPPIITSITGPVVTGGNVTISGMFLNFGSNDTMGSNLTVYNADDNQNFCPDGILQISDGSWVCNCSEISENVRIRLSVGNRISNMMTIYYNPSVDRFSIMIVNGTVYGVIDGQLLGKGDDITLMLNSTNLNTTYENGRLRFKMNPELTNEMLLKIRVFNKTSPVKPIALKPVILEIPAPPTSGGKVTVRGYYFFGPLNLQYSLDNGVNILNVNSSDIFKSNDNTFGAIINFPPGSGNYIQMIQSDNLLYTPDYMGYQPPTVTESIVTVETSTITIKGRNHALPCGVAFNSISYVTNCSVDSTYSVTTCFMDPQDVKSLTEGITFNLNVNGQIGNGSITSIIQPPITETPETIIETKPINKLALILSVAIPLPIIVAIAAFFLMKYRNRTHTQDEIDKFNNFIGVEEQSRTSSQSIVISTKQPKQVPQNPNQSIPPQISSTPPSNQPPQPQIQIITPPTPPLPPQQPPQLMILGQLDGGNCGKSNFNDDIRTAAKSFNDIISIDDSCSLNDSSSSDGY
ncbi:immunoglobulin E-set domain-containing protein [Tieghemostelium lacteum]|uniref:Immunoglobulin E-set domain-containing protein n=1 Tax=Tieghemostelium lacteum TaxID=361077 RepID=A0A152A639_TIELA|nr:immunoglobulin E-set domain-containing protein [Tieghemostelium lacteum]|eukprot:KYR01561.1 immunoglobulin E-set domain-containing protein [Tieghemostelium lacteum]